jgi:phosphoribosylformimino-5-aminoimidazole carboxamide ribonucleotide (ProFAR) isomerase
VSRPAARPGPERIPLLPLAAGDVVRLAAGGVTGRPLPEEPAAVARRLHRAGAGALHLWDLDGLAAGRLQALLDVLDVLMAVPVPLALRAGFSDLEEMGQALSRGVARVVVEAGAGVEAVAAAAGRFGPGRVLPALEIRSGRLAGCGADAGTTPGERLRRLAAAGMKDVLIVDLDRLGRPGGADKALARALAGHGPELIWAGGDRPAPGEDPGIVVLLAEPEAWLEPEEQPAEAGRKRA